MVTASVDQLPAVQRALVAATIAAAGLIFWRPSLDHFGTPRTTAVAVLVLATVVLAAVGAIRSGRILLPRAAATGAAVLFLGALGVNWLAADDRMLAALGPFTRYSGALAYTAYVVVFLAVLRYFGPAQLRLLGRTFVGVLSIVTAYGLFQLVGVDPWHWRESADLLLEREGVETLVNFSTLGNVDFAGAFVGISFPFVLWWGLSATTTTTRVLAGVLATGAVVYAVGTEAFQGPVTVLVSGGFVAAVWVSDRRHHVRTWSRAMRRRAVAVAVGAATFVALGLLALSPTIQEEIDTGLVDRTRFWEAAVEMFTDEPLTGHGLGSYSVEFLKYRSPALAADSGYEENDAAHNVYVNMLAEGGVILVAAFFGVLGVTGRALVRGLRHVRDDRRLLLAAFGGAWFAYLTQAFVSIDVSSIALLHWVIAGGIIVLGERPELRQFTFASPGWTTPRMVAASLVALFGLVAAFFVVVPLRADLAAGSARDLRREGQNAAALAEAQRATDLAPWEGAYWAAHASIVTNLGNPAAALASGERAARETPGSSRFAVGAAQVAELAGDIDRAAAWYGEALERDPHNPELMEDAARFELGHGSPARAVALLRRAVELRPGMVSAWELLVDAYRAIGDQASARRAAERVAVLKS